MSNGLEFEGDPIKDEANRRKHGVSFREAASVWLDPNAVTIVDPRHSSEEERYLTLGFSNRGRPLIVAWTPRGTVTRIISARRTLPREMEHYG